MKSQIPDHYSVNFLEKGRVLWFQSLFREFTLCYKIRIRFPGQVYYSAFWFVTPVHSLIKSSITLLYFDQFLLIWGSFVTFEWNSISVDFYTMNKVEFVFVGKKFGHYIIFHSNHLFWLHCVLCFYLSGKVALQVWFSETNLSLVVSEQIWYFKPTLSRCGSFQVKSVDYFRTIWMLKRRV